MFIRLDKIDHNSQGIILALSVFCISSEVETYIAVT